MARPAVAGTASQVARRQRILDAALELLDDRAYDQVQIRDVAERAEVALGTLYRYFPSKEQLFAHALLEWSRRSGPGRRPAGGTDAERLGAVLRRALRGFERHPNFFQLISVLGAVTDPAVAEPFQAYREHFLADLVSALDGLDPDDATVVAAMCAAHIGWLLTSWSHGATTMRAVEDQVARAVRLLCG